MRFMSRSEMVLRTYSWAPSTFLCIRIISRLVVTTLRTSKQLSRRTVSMPCTAAPARSQTGHRRTASGQAAGGTCWWVNLHAAPIAGSLSHCIITPHGAAD